MKALIPTGDPAQPVVLAEVPEPVPRENEALVRVEAFSINRGETFKLEPPTSKRPGTQPIPAERPAVQPARADRSSDAAERRVHRVARSHTGERPSREAVQPDAGERPDHETIHSRPSERPDRETIRSRPSERPDRETIHSRSGERPDHEAAQPHAGERPGHGVNRAAPSSWGERPGKDVAGLVVQPAADGSGPTGIARVVGHPMAGGWAEFVAVPTDALAVLPDTVSAVQGAALPLAGLTAIRLLRTAGPLLGRRVLLTGASGGVGHYLTELAAAAGAEITAVTRDAERGARLAELGAAEIIHHPADARGPYDLVLESTGGEALPIALARLARRGTLIWFGQASRTPVTLDFFDFFSGPESAVIRHFHYLDSDTSLADDLATLVRLTAEGRLHPEIGRVADWADTATTLTDLRDRRIRGKAVLTVS